MLHRKLRLLPPASRDDPLRYDEGSSGGRTIQADEGGSDARMLRTLIESQSIAELLAAVIVRNVLKAGTPQAAHECLYVSQEGALIAGPGPMILAVELDEPSPRYGCGEVTAGADAHRPVAAAMQNQRGRSYARQQGADVRVTQRFE